MRKQFSLLIVWLLLSQIMKAQLGSGNFIPNYKDYLTRIAPSSPTAAAFQKYGDIPVDVTSGSQQISIPIVTLKVGSFSWPLSLSYHTNGVKVSEVAPNVGLGWVLNGVGLISQKVVGPDDLANKNVMDSIRRYLDVSSTGGVSCIYGGDAELGLEFAQGTTNGLPDLFYLNEPSHNLKFFLKYNDSGYAMPASPLKIKFNRDALNLSNQKWVVLDEQGNYYEYSVFGRQSTVSTCSNNSPHSLSTSSNLYYLKKIITNQNQEIDFYYSSTSFSYFMPKEEVFYEPAYTGCTLCALQKPINYSCSSSETSSEQRLDSIKCSNGEFVRLSYSTRLDLTGAFKLDSVIHGYNYSGPVNVKKWNLTYNYFDNTSSNQDSLRLKLVKVAVSSLDDSISENYSMVYDSTILPGRLSYAVDSFGFYNGVDTNTTYLTNIANRKLSNTYVSAGSLKRIYYPTGGYSVFQYGLNRIVGGNQVESITDYDGYGNVSNYRSYVYKYAKSASTKFYDQFTSHVTTTNNQQNTIGCSSPEFQVCNNTGSDWIWGYQCPYYRYKSSPAVLPVYSTFTDNAKYDSVYEYFGANGQNGYKLYVLGFPKNRAASAYMGIDNQVVKTNIYKLGSDNNYYIINSKVDSLMVLPQADTNYFNAPYDVRQQYTYGAISELDRDELTTTCGTSSSNCMPRVILQNYCYLSSSPLYKTMTINTDYAYNGSSIDSLKTVINYSYSGLPQYNPIVITTTNSKGEVYSENKKFVADIVTGGPHSSVYDSMAVNNRLSQEIIDSVVKEPGQKISLTKTNFDFVGGSIIQPVLVQQSIGPNPLNDIITVSLYDAKGNMVQGKGRDGINITYLYGYNYTYVIAKIIGADYTQVMTKLSSLGATNDIRYTALQSITDENSLRATLASLRIINNAFATVYTYLPYVGISSETNSNGYTTYYEYDKLGRLFLIKDKDKNIIKKYCYNYAGQPESCSVYWNNTKSKDFDKSNCSYPNVGTTVTYTVSSHTYYSTISTAAADTMALHDININGQHYADSLGTCFLPTIYARIEYTDYYNDGTTTTATVLIKFYYDSGCTKPYSINNLNVNYKYVTSNCDGSSTITLNNSQLCSGFQYSLGTQTLYIDDGFVCKNYDYSVTAGTGYVAK